VSRFYLDHNVADRVGQELAALGHQVAYARRLGLAGATDATHLLTAMRHGAVLVTNDQDFLALHAAWLEWPLAWGIAPAPVHPGILLIKQGQMGGAVLAARTINTHVAGSPVLSNTLWLWTLSGRWISL
jgi:hypothetical protein